MLLIGQYVSLRHSGHVVRLLVYSKGLAVRLLQKYLFLKTNKQRMIFIFN